MSRRELDSRFPRNPSTNRRTQREQQRNDAYVREDDNITSGKSILNPLPQSVNSKKLDPFLLFSLPIIDFGKHASQERIPAKFAPPQGALPVWMVMKTLQLFEIPEFSAQTSVKQQRLDLAFAALSRDQNDNPRNQILSSPDSDQEELWSCVSTEKDELEKHIAKMRTEGQDPFPMEIRQEDVEEAIAAANLNDDDYDFDDDDSESPLWEEVSEEDDDDEGNSDGDDDDDSEEPSDDNDNDREEEDVRYVEILLLDSDEAAAILLKMLEYQLRLSPHQENPAGLPPLPLRQSLSVVPPSPSPLRRVSPTPLALFLFFRALGRVALVNLLSLRLGPQRDPPGEFRPAQGSGGGTESPPPPPESSSAGAMEKVVGMEI